MVGGICRWLYNIKMAYELSNELRKLINDDPRSTDFGKSLQNYRKVPTTNSNIQDEISIIVDAQFVSVDKLIDEAQSLLNDSKTASAQRIIKIAKEQLSLIQKLQKVGSKIAGELK